MFVGLARICNWPLLVSLIAGSLLAGPCSPLFSQDPQAAQTGGTDKVPSQVIAVRSPEEAQQVIEQLKKGMDFSQLARE
jgi:hypothetical protein